MPKVNLSPRDIELYRSYICDEKLKGRSGYGEFAVRALRCWPKCLDEIERLRALVTELRAELEVRPRD